MRVRELLFGRDATRAQVNLALASGLCASTWAAVCALDAGLGRWVSAAAVLVAFDVIGGAVACSMPPLRRQNALLLGSPARYLAFAAAHTAHLAIIVVVLLASSWTSLAVIVAAYLGAAAIVGISPRTTRLGFAIAGTLVVSALSYHLAESAAPLWLLLPALFLKVLLSCSLKDA